MREPAQVRGRKPQTSSHVGQREQQVLIGVGERGGEGAERESEGGPE